MEKEPSKINELYAQYKSTRPEREVLEDKIRRHNSLSYKLERAIKGSKFNEPHEETREHVESRITDILRNQPGKYKLEEISYKWGIQNPGFSYGFDYPIEKEVFNVGLWANDNWGILVQKQASGKDAEIEIAKDLISRAILHLPDGFKIPVGPLQFKEESLPMSEKEITDERNVAIAAAKQIGIKVNKQILEMAKEMSPGFGRKHINRYFYWQPEITDEPKIITIDFNSLKFYNMGLNLKNAPVFTNTKILTENNFRINF